MKWFTLFENKVEGPYPTETLIRKVESGELPRETLIWGSLQHGWKSFEWWRKALPHLKSAHTEDNVEDWYMVQQGRRHGPFSKEKLVSQLKTMAKQNEAIAKILIWTKGLKKWTQVIEFHDLMNELGIDQRKHPRAKISGKVTLIFKGNSYTTSLKSISEGGLGAEPIPMVFAGEEVQVCIEAEALGAPINTKAEIRFANEANLGLQFLSINSEYRSNIVSYVKEKMAPAHKKAAA